MTRLHLPYLALSISVAGKGYKSGSLSSAGAVAAATAGYAALANPLGVFGVCLLSFYLAGSRATKVKAAVKATYAEQEHGPTPTSNAAASAPSKPPKVGGNRTPAQVACNALLGVVCAVAWRVLYETRWEEQRWCVVDSRAGEEEWSRPLILAAVAFWGACCGDTFASELGILSRSPPFLLSTFSRSPRGTNGAMSAWGTLVSLLGGVYVGVLAVGTLALQGQARQCGGYGWAVEVLAVGGAAGFGGSLLDSLLGLLFQPTYFSLSRKLVVHHPPSGKKDDDTIVLPGTALFGALLSNNAVNFVSTGVVAGLAGWMSDVTFPRNASPAQVTVSRSLGNEGGVWVLSMNGQQTNDNRLTPPFIRDAMLPALDYVELEWHRACERGNKKGALVLTGESEVGKFFSNGLQLECMKEYPTFFQDYYYVLLSRLLSFPLHTIAAVNGHCFAGGLCLALACDWRICRPDRTWLCMNELAFGAPLPDGMYAVLAARLSSPVIRNVMLTAHRYTADEALKEGIVDEIVKEKGSGKCVERAVERARELSGLAETRILTSMKQTLYAPALAILKYDERAKPDEHKRDLEKRFEELKKSEGEAEAKARAKL
ncbi:hypothetical protein JCM11641_007028 [Rhodosporidiobolus odoratus]